MDEEAKRRILDEARANVARLADVEQRHAATDVLAEHCEWQVPEPEPPKPARGLDTAPPVADIDERIAEAIRTEREYWHAVIAETLALERRDVDERLTRLEILERELERRALDPDFVEKLGDDARKVTAQIASLQATITELRAIIASEARRASASVIDFPTTRYPRELN